MAAASVRADANDNGVPMTGSSPGSRPEASNTPNVSLAGRPSGRRKRSAQDLAPDGCTTRYKPAAPPSRISSRSRPGRILATAAAVRALDIGPSCPVVRGNVRVTGAAVMARYAGTLSVYNFRCEIPALLVT